MNAAGDLAMLARVTASLAAVIALAFLASRLARRASLRASGRGIQVVERIGLSREASLAVVDVAGRGLVLGVTAHAVTIVSELTDPEVALLRTHRPGASAARPGAPAARPDAAAPRQGEVVVTELPEGAAQTLARLSPGDRPAPAARPGTGSVLDPRTWRQGVEALRDLTARRR